MNDAMTRGQRIRDERLKRALTQDAAAKLIGVSRTILSMWERDKIKRIHPYNINLIARALDIDPELLRKI